MLWPLEVRDGEEQKVASYINVQVREMEQMAKNTGSIRGEHCRRRRKWKAAVERRDSFELSWKRRAWDLFLQHRQEELVQEGFAIVTYSSSGVSSAENKKRVSEICFSCDLDIIRNLRHKRLDIRLRPSSLDCRCCVTVRHVWDVSLSGGTTFTTQQPSMWILSVSGRHCWKNIESEERTFRKWFKYSCTWVSP